MFSNNFFPNEKEINNNIIITPPKNENHMKIKNKILVIDSRDRNTETFPSASDYEIDLIEEYKHIKYLQLIQYQIPNSMYLIEDDNNQIHFSEKIIFDNEKLLKKDIFKSGCAIKENSFTISNGNYELSNQIEKKLFNQINYLFSDDLTHEIERKFNFGGEKDHIQVLYNKRRDNYWFVTDFKIKNKKPSPLTLFFRGERITYGEKNIQKIIKRDKYNSIVRDTNNNPVYEEIINEKYKYVFKENSLGKLLGFKNKNYNGYIGIFEINVNQFKQEQNLELVIGQSILLINYENNNEREIYKISNIDKNNIIFDKNCEYKKSYIFSSIIKSENRRVIKNNFKILKINGCKRLQSSNKNIHDSFCLAGLTGENMSLENPNADKILYKKSFNPILPRLNRMKIQFLNYNFKPYQFNGQEHLLVFLLGITNQSINYKN